MQSGMHSHCFVRFETIYTPITHEDDRQKYQSVPCFKGAKEVQQFFREIATGPEEGEKWSGKDGEFRSNEIALQMCLQTIRRCQPRNLKEAKSYFKIYRERFPEVNTSHFVQAMDQVFQSRPHPGPY